MVYNHISSDHVYVHSLPASLYPLPYLLWHGEAPEDRLTGLLHVDEIDDDIDILPIDVYSVIIYTRNTHTFM